MDISITQKSPTGIEHVSTLSFDPQHPDVLTVTGVITHAYTIRPTTAQDADNLRSYLFGVSRATATEGKRYPYPTRDVTVAGYFKALLGAPARDPKKLMAKLGEDFPLDSTVGDACRGAIEAAADLIRHINFVGGEDPHVYEVIKEATLRTCGVYAFA